MHQLSVPLCTTLKNKNKLKKQLFLLALFDFPSHYLLILESQCIWAVQATPLHSPITKNRAVPHV